ncbi:uncharacterized protein PRCAT00002920001 [Priceomyces carsonii]|uniref:uncharacterized protein n=1 Tax=Priceomyces carsonii TaxID=28549 RepID=UPI002ED95A84|nr:unnamed protein product [Priceomyces carsonii]
MSTANLRNSSQSLANLFRSHRSRFNASFLSGTLGGAIGSVALLAFYENEKNKRYNSPKGWKGPLLAGTAIVNIAEVPKDKGFKEFQQVYNDIAEKIHSEEDADEGDGRYGLLTRLSWHTSGTYDKKSNTGGSFGGTMIYAPEQIDGENNGLEVGRDFLYEFLVKYPWLSRGDLWTLGGVCAVQESGGPKIPWRPGRKDLTDRKRVPENGRLPDASKDGNYVHSIFSRMGFSDQEAVALIGAHCLGQCHKHNTGYDGPWGPTPNMFTNDFFVRLLGKWHVKKWDGKKQYEDDETNQFMMLPTDMALKEEPFFIKYVKQYADDQDLFFKDFRNAYSTLLELGVTYPKDQEKWEFQTLEDQEDDE